MGRRYEGKTDQLWVGLLLAGWLFMYFQWEYFLFLLTFPISAEIVNSVQFELYKHIYRTIKLTLDLTICNKSDIKWKETKDWSGHIRAMKNNIHRAKHLHEDFGSNKFIFLNMYFNANATVCVVLLLHSFSIIVSPVYQSVINVKG